MTQFLDTRVDKSLGVTGAWTDIDLSSNIPTSATGAIFRIYNVGVSNDYKYGLRKKGSTDERYERVEPQAQITQFIGVDSNRKCQGKIENTSVDFKLVGYTEGDATFFTNGIDKSISTWDTWEDIDLSADLPSGAVAAIFEVHNTHTAPRKYALRKKGSTDERFEDACWKLNISFIVGVDANLKCQGKIETSSVDFYLMGYLTSGTAETNGVNRSLGTTGSYIDITESNAPSGSTGVFVEIKSALVPKQHDYRKNGASHTSYYKLQCRHPVLAVGLDANKKWEGKIEDTGTDFYTLFYFASGETTKVSSAGLRVIDRKTKESSASLAVQETKTKASSASLAVQETKTKASSAGITIFGGGIKESSAGLSVSGYEDFTTFTEVDVGADRIQKTIHHIDHASYRNETTYLYKDYGVDHFGDFEHKIKIKAPSSDNSGYSPCWVLANDLGDTKTLENANKTFIMFVLYYSGSSLSVRMEECSIGNIYQVNNTGGFSLGDWIYIKIVKSGTSLTGYLYSDSSYLTLVDTLNLTLHADHEFRYLYGCSSHNGGYVYSMTTDIENFNIVGLDVFEAKTKESSASLRVVARHTKVSSAGLSIQETPTKTSTAGLRIIEQHTKASSAGLRVVVQHTKTSTAGLRIIEQHTKASSAGLRVVVQHTKTSTAGLVVMGSNTKVSSAGVSIQEEGTKISSQGLTIVDKKTKVSSAGLNISGMNTKESSAGLTIQETFTKTSSAGVSVVGGKIKTSSAGLRVITRHIKESSANLTIKATYTKESSVGLNIITRPVKVSSGGMTISGSNTKESSAGLTVYESTLKKGLFYGKLGDVILETVMPESFRISEEINRIPTFEFEVANSEANRTAIAANITALFKIYWQHHGVETHVFTGIINADGIEYISLSNIRITGFASYAKLGWPLFKHLDIEDAEPVNKVFEYNGTYTDYTTAANNATINDITVNFADVNHCLYIGEANPFWGLQVKYSTKGVPAGAVVVIEFSKGVGIWGTLDVLDETNAFTEDPGTYDIIIPHPPSDWARNTVNGISKFWIRWRIISGAYTTAPKLDQIHTVNVDVYRVFYYETSARQILLDVLEDTEYSMDAIDTCPEDEINIWAEYESPLRVIAAIPAALTWTDTDGSKKSYQWWIDEAKKVHMKQKRGTTYSDDITGDITIFNNLVDYFNISNRLFGFSKRDGLSQIRAIIEDKPSQTTHTLREIAVPKNEIGKYLTLKASLEKDITYSKNPMQRIKGSVSTEFWGLRDYEVGDTITLHQGEWVVDEGEFQIVKADIGPILTQLNLGISREHLDGLKSNMKRAFDISNVQMHGSTSLLTAGPETANYERKSDGSVFSAKLKIEIPSEVIKTHKVLLSWTIGKYRASVNDNSGDVPPHNHGGTALIGGGIDADVTGDDGGFTPGIEDGGEHTPAMLDKAHKHVLDTTIQVEYTSQPFISLLESEIYGLDHRHEMGITGAPDRVGAALIPPLYMGSACTSGRCVTGVYDSEFARGIHIHPNIGHYTEYTEPNAYLSTAMKYNLTSITPYIFAETSDNENPAHAHTMDEVAAHPHAGVIEPDHGHTTPEVAGHTDHAISEESGYTVPVSFGIHEEAAGTVLELLINGEKVGEYSGAQTEIRVDGYLTGSTNTIEIQPIPAETGKKGSATISGSGILFIEPKKF